MVEYNTGWSLEITPEGRIFVEHYGKPHFKVEIIFARPNSYSDVKFDGKWEDRPLDAMQWYMTALEFYKFAMVQREKEQNGAGQKSDAEDLYRPH